MNTRFLFLIALFVTLNLHSPVPLEAAAKNVLVIVADDLGLELGCYGNTTVETPHLDRLSREGTRFNRAFCTTASCSASRSVILTGLQNHANGQFGHAHHGFRTHDWVKSLPALLKTASYRTQMLGKLHVLPESAYPFDDSPTAGLQGKRSPQGFADQARRFIHADESQPFFIYACSIDPHRDFGNQQSYHGESPVKYEPEQIDVPTYLPDSPECRAELAQYYQSISRLDQLVGKLLDVLRETNHLDDTLVLFLSDNGAPFPGAKTTLYEPGMRLPLIVRSPTAKRRNVQTQAMVTWADIVPTVLDYTGTAGSDYELHGRSFLKVLEEEHPADWNEIYGSHSYHERQMYYPMRVIRTDRYKCIFNIAHPLPFPFSSDLYSSTTWQALLKGNAKQLGKRSVEAYVHRPRFELYDLKNDPDELVNLADSPDHATILADLQSKLKDFQKRTKDPWMSKYRYE